MSMKLKNLIKESFGREEEELPKLSVQEKREVLRMIGEYNVLGKSLDRMGNLPEMVEKLGRIAEAAKSITLSETDGDWMDKKTINENMKRLDGCSKEFKKMAQEAHQLDQRMTALYEDMGHILERFFEIKEPIEEVSSINDF